MGSIFSMARIRSFRYVASDSNVHPTEVDAQWCTVALGESKFLQVSTFGSDLRASKPKVSQTMQFDEDSVLALLEGISQTFPELSVEYTRRRIVSPDV